MVVRKRHTESVSQFLRGVPLYRRLILICYLEAVEYTLYSFFFARHGGKKSLIFGIENTPIFLFCYPLLDEKCRKE